MVLASRSTTMRRAGAFLALVAFEIGAVVILHRLGELPWLRVPFDDLEGWLRTSAPEDVLAAVVRLVALGAAWWLLGSTALYVLARISRIPSAIRALELVTLPSVRRIADQAIALTLATSIMSGGAGAAIASPAVMPVRTESVVASHDPLSTWARASTFGYRPAPGTTDPPSYRPEAAGPVAPATDPGSGPPAGGTPAAAGVDSATAAAAPAYRPEAAGASAGQPASGAPAGADAGGSPATTAASPAYQPRAAGPDTGRAEPGAPAGAEAGASPATTAASPAYQPKAAGTTPGAGATTTSSTSSSSTTSSTRPTTTTGPPSTTSPPTTIGPPTTTSPPSTTSPPTSSSTSPASSSTTTTGPATTKPSASPRYVPRAAGTTPSSTRPPTPSAPRYTPSPAGPPHGRPPAPLPEAPPGKGETALHRVAEGDNLWTIARDRLAKVRGRPAAELSEREIARYWLDVVDTNRASLRSGDPDLIFPGEIIKLPPVARHEP